MTGLYRTECLVHSPLLLAAALVSAARPPTSPASGEVTARQLRRLPPVRRSSSSTCAARWTSATSCSTAPTGWCSMSWAPAERRRARACTTGWSAAACSTSATPSSGPTSSGSCSSSTAPRTTRSSAGPTSIQVSFGADQTFMAWSSTEAHGRAGRRGRGAGRRRPRSSSSAGPRHHGRPRPEEPRITVTWDRANIADVVAGFAAFSGRTIILGKDIKGEVTAEVKNQPWPQAFQAILASAGPLGPGDGRAASSGSTRPRCSRRSTRWSRWRPASCGSTTPSAGSLAKTVEGILTKGRGQVVADTGSNSLIITDTRSRVANVTEFVRGLDIRTPAAVDPGQDRLRGPDRHRGAGHQVRPGRPATSSSTSWCSAPTRPTGRAVRPERQRRRPGRQQRSPPSATPTPPSPARRSTWSSPPRIGGFSLTTFLSALERRSWPTSRPSRSSRRSTTARPTSSWVRRPRSASSTPRPAPARRRPRQRAVQGDRYPAHRHAARHQQPPDPDGAAHRALRDSAARRGRPGLRLPEAEGRQPAAGERRRDRGHRRPDRHRGRPTNRTGIPLLSGLPIVGKLFSFSEDRGEPARPDHPGDAADHRRRA